MPATASRLSVFTESVICGTIRLDNQYGAINLAQGFPDFDPPEELLAALECATRRPHHQYAVTLGAPRFREALARKIRRFTGLHINPDKNLLGHRLVVRLYAVRQREIAKAVLEPRAVGPLL